MPKTSVRCTTPHLSPWFRGSRGFVSASKRTRLRAMAAANLVRSASISPSCDTAPSTVSVWSARRRIFLIGCRHRFRRRGHAFPALDPRREFGALVRHRPRINVARLGLDYPQSWRPRVSVFARRVWQWRWSLVADGALVCGFDTSEPVVVRGGRRSGRVVLPLSGGRCCRQLMAKGAFIRRLDVREPRVVRAGSRPARVVFAGRGVRHIADSSLVCRFLRDVSCSTTLAAFRTGFPTHAACGVFTTPHRRMTGPRIARDCRAVVVPRLR